MVHHLDYTSDQFMRKPEVTTYRFRLFVERLEYAHFSKDLSSSGTILGSKENFA